MSTGREKFKKNKVFINIFVKFFKLIPKFLRVFIWDVISKYSQLPFIGLRYILAKSMLKSCGDNIRIGTNVQILGMKELELGNNISIHANCYIDASGGIAIRDNVSIAHNSSILFTNHGYSDDDIPIKYNPTISDKVDIYEDVWIGCGCRILAGVNIQKRSIVAAGAVVNKNIESNTIVGGIPALKIKKI